MLPNHSAPRNARYVTFFLAIFSISIFPQIQMHAQQTQLTGHENFIITLSNAKALVSNYQQTASSGNILAQYFGKDALQVVLNQANCIGIRIYNGKNNSGSQTFVIVGVDNNGHDMTNGPLLDLGFPCPPLCDSAKVLGH